MTAPSQPQVTPTPQVQVQATGPSDKELNFRALQSRYERELAQERAAREAAERKIAERESQPANDDDDDEPYVDKKRLQKTLSKFGQEAKAETQSEIQRAVQTAIREEKKANWVSQNKDFYDVLGHADKLMEADPDLAESILDMPEGFERQKLVYKNIKALGLHKPKEEKASIQSKIDANQRGPYYQPSNVGTAPYSSQGDFSQAGQKQAYDKMQELKSRMRLG